MRILVSVCVAGVVLAGCAGGPSGKDTTYSAAYVGDQSAVVFDEVVIAVPSKGVETGFANIHVALSAIINPKKKFLSETYDAAGIIRRSYPRIAAAIVTVVEQQEAPAANINTLRESIHRAANRVLSATFSKWSSAEDYEVEIVVASLYVTDGSVGRNARRTSWWE